MNEIELLKVVRHKNIVEYIEIIEDPQSIYIVLEFISGETLLKYIIDRERLEE
jgi:5'-AMP-activated protein kinase catalytic alpha subunit